MVPDVGKFKTKPMRHQVDGVEHVTSMTGSALNDEQGTGKSKQAIDAACTLAEAGEVDTILVVCPAGVRGVWAGQEFGQVRAHCWLHYAVGIWDGQALKRGIRWTYDGPHLVQVRFIVASYQFLRSSEARAGLEEDWLRGHKVMLICDEAHSIKNRSAKQSKAVRALRDSVDYCLLLTGTPYANDVTDLWHQVQVMDPMIYPYNWYAFRAMFAKTRKMTIGVTSFEKVIGVKNKDRLDLMLKPYILRRMKKDCLDLPPKVYTTVEVPLADSAWKMYESMRDEMIAWMGGSNSIASNAGVRAMRLQQLTSGFLGGVRLAECQRCGRPEQDHADMVSPDSPFVYVDAVRGINCEGFYSPVESPVEVDRSKLDAYLEWRDGQESPVVTWARFRPEIERLEKELTSIKHGVGLVWGGQTKNQRDAVLAAFERGELDDLIGQQQAGGVGLNLQRSSTVAYLSNTFSLVDRDQSEDRNHRKGTVNKVNYTDFVCTSPDGRKTIDHAVLRALREKRELADFTMSEWRSVLVK